MNPHLAAPPVTVGPPVAGARRVAVVVHGRDQRAHAASSLPDRSAAMAKAKATEKPT